MVRIGEIADERHRVVGFILDVGEHEHAGLGRRG
jgi:hypothetical protein